MDAGIRSACPTAAVELRPMADGGEGTLDAILGTHGRRETAQVRGANQRPVAAAYGLIEQDGAHVAVLEAAQVVGWAFVDARHDPVAERTSAGLGELLRLCLDRGLRRFVLALGGSSTNDGGAGLLAALGLRLFDDDGREIGPRPLDLARCARVDFSALDPRVTESRITVLADVSNPLTGARGATAVYGPQKGIAREHISAFDTALARLAERIAAARGRDFSDIPGAGAAGGLGFAALVLGADLRAGAPYVAEQVGLPAALDCADWVLTGEGRSDEQTLAGKAPAVVAQLARAHGVPCALLSGEIDAAARDALARLFARCESLVSPELAPAVARREAMALLAQRAAAIARAFATRRET